MTGLFVGTTALDDLGGFHPKRMAGIAQDLKNSVGTDEIGVGITARWRRCKWLRFGMKRGRGGDSWNSVFGLCV